MKLSLATKTFAGWPEPGERVRIADGRIARVIKVRTRWEHDRDEAGSYTPIRPLKVDLWLEPETPSGSKA